MHTYLSATTQGEKNNEDYDERLVKRVIKEAITAEEFDVKALCKQIQQKIEMETKKILLDEAAKLQHFVGRQVEVNHFGDLLGVGVIKALKFSKNYEFIGLVAKVKLDGRNTANFYPFNDLTFLD